MKHLPGGWLAALLVLMACAIATDVAADEPGLFVEKGFVFIDGEFIPGPYVVSEATSGASINGHLVTLQPLQRSGGGPQRGGPSLPAREPRPGGREFDGQRPRPGRPGPGGERPDQDSPEIGRQGAAGGGRGFGRQDSPRGERGGSPSPDRRQSAAREIVSYLEDDAVVVVFGAKPAAILQHGTAVWFFEVLVSRGADVSSLELLLRERPQADQAQWKTWLSNYSPPEPLLNRASSIVESRQQAGAQNRAEISATRRLRASAYPLTVGGMVLGVLSLGHLLTSPPRGAAKSFHGPRSRRQSRATFLSVGLVVVLSTLDLAWTVLASQAGQMNELNPVGSQMIENPLILTGFKAAATFLSCGLLLALRRHKSAQWASWWMCLVCTLLTFRWLVLNSMFVV